MGAASVSIHRLWVATEARSAFRADSPRLTVSLIYRAPLGPLLAFYRGERKPCAVASQCPAPSSRRGRRTCRRDSGSAGWASNRCQGASPMRFLGRVAVLVFRQARRALRPPYPPSCAMALTTVSVSPLMAVTPSRLSER
jgi:hypothetical protein